MEYEPACDDDVWKHMAIIVCLQTMLDDVVEKKKGPRRGGSKPGRQKSQPRQRLEGHTMLYNNYICVSATHANIFCRYYRMCKELFISSWRERV
jgi:hypothetical protein